MHANKNIPQVTGISPNKGPPGTLVTIRGENLGRNAHDVIGLRICGVDCIMTCEWKSSKRLTARTGKIKGTGDIIVVTASGGIGTCTVQFRAYIVEIEHLEESAIWVDESKTWMDQIHRNRMTSPLMSPDQDDPLGISDEATETKFPGSLPEMFPNGSGNTSEESFVPAWFLLENHHGTSFDDLKAGLAYLKLKSTQRNEGPLAFVKANLTTFMDCQDALANMHMKLVEDQVATPSGQITKSLEDILVKANRSAAVLFQDVLGRKDRADATRNALSVLQRFKFLFNLPCTIDRNIKKEDYDVVITDYMRAKSLFGDTEVQVFRKVYQEVEKRISAFRDMLYKKLLQLPASLEEQKRLIRFLVHLETSGDPAWQCLENENTWLQNLLHTCKEQHIAKENGSEKENQEEKTDESPKLGGKARNKPPEKVQFVEDLTSTLTEHLPDFWRLGQAYLSGKLMKESKDKSVRVDGNKHIQFKQMIRAVILLFSRLLRAAFLPATLSELKPTERQAYGEWKTNKDSSPIAWLPVSVRIVRNCVLSVSNLELPNESMELLQEIAFDMRTNCMATLFKQALEDVENLHKRETWVVDPDDEHGGTTLLPAYFETLVNETMQHLQEVLLTRPGESEIFTQRSVQEEATRLIGDLMKSFANLLDRLAIIGNEERDSCKRPSSRLPSHRHALHPYLFDSSSECTGMPSLETRLMIVLSNCQHTQEHILPRIMDNLQKHNYPEMDKVLEVSRATFHELDEKLFERYIEEKSNPIIGALEQNMYAGRFDWNDCLTSTGVRRYIKESMMGMIRVHAEVYAISPSFVPRVMCQIVELVVDELGRLIQCVTGFNRNGALQARLELYAMELTVSAYRTDATVTSFKEAIACLPELKGSEDKRLLEDLLNQFQSQMRFQLLCFQPDIKTS